MSSEQLSKEQVRALKDSFNLFDTNNDGAISVDELLPVLHSLGMSVTEAELQELINEVDLDGDGIIEFNEFLSMMAKRMHEEGDQNDANVEVREAFEFFDKDGNGFISAAELHHLMDKLGEKLDDSEVEEMIKMADSSGDQQISLEEYMKIISTNRRRRRGLLN